ncbi:related to Autophagy protein 16 [Cephalotrichum gorgonifer]|uniref:Related to Autophagy protein 16 n=1 Tax=Cephalotrichum gorgonifer TaxID=2041049 RepID=A0AAE8N150_9PEZI|nr:related to Autophagy protein 16 [Cephalotrichum gorgonifer]
MANWKGEYLAYIRAAEKNNPVNLEIVEACSNLVDRVSALEAEKAVLERSATPSTPTSRDKPRHAPPPPPLPAADEDTLVAQLQRDLAEALRARGYFETRAKNAEAELEKTRVANKDDARSLRELTAERQKILTKLRDRDHELREQRKLSADIQDEMITLNLQLSMAEKERDKVKKENRELVDRWMKSKGAEAEKMNRANEAMSQGRR